MSNGTVDAVGRLRWGLRRHAALLVFCVVVLAALAPVAQLARGEVYEAAALVVARQVEVNSASLPRFGESVFHSGAVARAVAADPAFEGSPDQSLVERLTVEAPQDSVVFRVVARDQDPNRAARLANVAAVAYVAELNRPGAGVGSFAVQDVAQPPSEPSNSALDLPMALGVGAIAGLIFGIGVVALLLAVRRPVIDDAGVEAILGAPVIGTVTIPRTRSRALSGPRGVSGLSPIVRRLLQGPVSTIALVAAPGVTDARRHLAAMLAVALGRRAPIDLVADADLRAAVTAGLGPDRVDARNTGPEVPTANRGVIRIIDGEDLAERHEPSAPGTSTLLVVPVGIAQSQLEGSAADFVEGELAGVILFRRGATLAQEQLRPTQTPAPIPVPVPVPAPEVQGARMSRTARS